jgi:4-hydroxy-4-methyl-2-oxoglutarate aldolase
MPLLPSKADAQLWTWTKEQMLQYTKAWTGERFPDGRPKVPDQWLERAKDTSAEEITISNGGRGGGGNVYSQYEGDFRVLHYPGLDAHTRKILQPLIEWVKAAA